MSIRATFIGSPGIQQATLGAELRVRQIIHTEIDRTAVLAHSEIVRSLGGQRRGRVYNVPGIKRRYHASQPGEPPASATGRLRSSVFIASLKANAPTQPATIIAPAKYALSLEKGTRRIRPRPFFKPVFDKQAPLLKAKIVRALRGGFS